MKQPGKYSYAREWFDQSLITSYDWAKEGKTHYFLKTHPNGGPLPFSLHLALATGPYFPPPEVAYCPN